MALSERIRIARRFQRSIRIDADLIDPKSLEGFICPRSSADVLIAMARHVSEAGQGAFTWTGPYGSGKSSLVVALSALLNGSSELRKSAVKVFGRKVTESIWDALPTGRKGWRVLPVVGRRDNAVHVIGEAAEAAGVAKKPGQGWNETQLIKELVAAGAENKDEHGGLIVFIDEMGKFLEAAAQDDADIYVFQQLAEAASRSKGRLIIVGILHQAFGEYAHRLSHEMRDEWSKIQGRFIDLAVSAAGDEQIDLISRAIETDRKVAHAGPLASAIAGQIRKDQKPGADNLARTLEDCWPLHPIVACLLGPISRRRFGQNQRSIFGFLNSSEPHGFQDFIKRAEPEALYEPHMLWDYLRANLEPSILASPDGHRWALAAEALERCESIGGNGHHIQVLKTIAVIDLFKERSGLVAGPTTLSACLPGITEKNLENVLSDLKGWSFVIFRKFLDAYAVFAGSDFDIDLAVRAAIEEVDELDFDALKALAGLQPVLAKRHYHASGALRWFDVNLTPMSELAKVSERYKPHNGAIGQFLLAIPTEGEREDYAGKLCREAARAGDRWDIVVGISKRSWAIVALARELLALEKVNSERPELQGDPVARREVAARLAALQSQLEAELRRAFDSAVWHRKRQKHAKAYRHAELNSLASDLADRRFNKSPRIHSELLNRQKPSTSAVAAQNELLRRMVMMESEPRLGIEGFPAEGGLYASLLQGTGLHRATQEGYRFLPPQEGEEDTACLWPMWEAALKYVNTNAKRTIALSELYDLWREQPFGIKDGLFPVLAVAFIVSQRDNVAVYREGMFRARFDDVDVQYLAKDAGRIHLRWMDLSDVARRLLSGMAEIVRTFDRQNALPHLEPIDVARGLIAIYDQLPSWTKRTMRLSANAIKIRELFKRARDPNQFLFDDIPALRPEIAGSSAEEDLEPILRSVQQGLSELVHAYPTMISRLRDAMLVELQVPNTSQSALAELRQRAENVRQLTGDFRLEAFVGRITQFEGSDESVASIASLAAGKPPRDWVDLDLDRAAVELADMAQKFLRAETFARVKGRMEKRHAMAVVVGVNGKPTPIMEEFAVGDSDREAIDNLLARLKVVLAKADEPNRTVVLAALAELSADYMGDVRRTLQPKLERAAS